MKTQHKVVKDKEFKDMYRVKYPDGQVSEDFYNLSRVKDHAAKLTETASRMARQNSLEGRG